MSDRPDTAADVREAIRKLIQDPVTRSLAHGSQLTLAQLETLLAASFSDENGINKSNRRLYCPSRSHISRGAYNRTLMQAQNNIIHSIYTVLLLGYVGLFDTSALQPFVELSDAIHGFVQEARQVTGDENVALPELNARLMETITALAKRHSFKGKL
jgi:hypothetical protein